MAWSPTVRAAVSQAKAGNETKCTIDVGDVDKSIVEAVVRHLRGSALEVDLPHFTQSPSMNKKRALAQLADLAHKLGIEPLQQIAMHAVCVSILRNPRAWDNSATRRLVIELSTLEGNSVRQILGQLRPRIEAGDCTIPTDEATRKKLTTMTTVSWGPGGQMQLKVDQKQD